MVRVLQNDALEAAHPLKMNFRMSNPGTVGFSNTLHRAVAG
jgi:hypothetical protein